MDEGSTVFYETVVSPTDLTPVLEALETVQQSLNLANQQLEQLHADDSLVFLALVLLIGVVIGCALGFMFSRMWQV